MRSRDELQGSLSYGLFVAVELVLSAGWQTMVFPMFSGVCKLPSDPPQARCVVLWVESGVVLSVLLMPGRRINLAAVCFAISESLKFV